MSYLASVYFVLWSIVLTAVMGSVQTPLPFTRLVNESTTIVKCTVLKVSPLVPDDDKQVSDDISDTYFGPKCFALTKILEVWKKQKNDGIAASESASVYDSQKYLMIAFGDSSRGISGVSHELTEGRTYVLFLRMIGPGMYQFTDCNSVYPISRGEVPDMGLNMNDDDIAKSKPTPVVQFKDRVERETR